MAYQNFYTTKLYTDVSAADTAITLETPPTVTSGRLVLEARNVSKREVIKYTGVSGNQVTGVLRGQGGTTAQTHLANTLVEMNLTAEDLEDAINVPNDIVTRFDESLGDFIASGLVWSQTALLVGEMTAGVVYIDGERLVIGALSGINFTASKDTYVDVGVDGVVDYDPVANGASAPALAGSHVRIAKVVTNGSGITSVVQTGVDSLRNTIRPSGSVTSDKLGLTSAGSIIPGFQSPATPNTWMDLPTAQSHTITIGASGKLLVIIGCQFVVAGSPAEGAMSIALSGANTIAANYDNSVYVGQAFNSIVGRAILLTGLTPGSTTVALKFNKLGGSSTSFGQRSLQMVTL